MPHSRRLKAFFDFRGKGLGWSRVSLYIILSVGVKVYFKPVELPSL